MVECAVLTRSINKSTCREIRINSKLILSLIDVALRYLDACHNVVNYYLSPTPCCCTAIEMDDKRNAQERIRSTMTLAMMYSGWRIELLV